MRHILFVDELAGHWEDALERACMLAAADCGDLHIAQLAGRFRTTAPPPSLRDAARIVSDIDARYPSIASITFSGPLASDARSIAACADQYDAELIVMRGRIESDLSGDQPFERALDVARHTAIPVLAVHTRPAGKYRRLLALVDDGEDARCVIDLALNIKSAEHVYAVHACSDEASPRQVEQAREALKRDISAARGQRTDAATCVTPIVSRHDVGSALVEQWDAVHPDLIVAATHNVHGLTAMVRRSCVAELFGILPFDWLVTNLQRREMPRRGHADTRAASIDDLITGRAP
jgi:nucleotide-binding universal stress UspA family protein